MPTSSVQSLSASELISFLAENYLKTIIIDVSSKFSFAIPGARHFPHLKSTLKPHVWINQEDRNILSETGDDNGFTTPDFSPGNSIFNQRIGGHVIVYDEDGLTDGAAQSVAHWIREEGECISCVYLQGGMTEFIKQYPTLLTNSSYPSTNLVNHDFLGSLGNIPSENPIQSIKWMQQELVDSVWFGKHIPGDQPSPIIDDFLYLSSCFACNQQHLDRYDIKNVIRMGWGFQNDCDETIKFYDYAIGDSPNAPIHQLLDAVTDIIETCRLNGERVLVHCHAGVSRSSTIVLAYLIRYKQMSLYDAWNQSYKIRPIIRPNRGFAMALKEYEMIHLQSESLLPLFWVSESYFHYMDYLEFMYRYSALNSNQLKEE
ncbi:protein-tyrosine phosphatase-like protein [Globomyces pollinis-pini]|nr:protein-tyrosine phosphatase-like protein [Globomyces pollinis-pini]KAJ2990858.1 Dual specificity protein phosphatase 18 [Globomyces sp. JEL0801]